MCLQTNHHHPLTSPFLTTTVLNGRRPGFASLSPTSSEESTSTVGSARSSAPGTSGVEANNMATTVSTGSKYLSPVNTDFSSAEKSTAETSTSPFTPIKSDFSTNLSIQRELFPHYTATFEMCALAENKTYRAYDIEKCPNYVVEDKILKRYADFELLEELLWLERVRGEVEGLENLQD